MSKQDSQIVISKRTLIIALILFLLLLTSVAALALGGRGGGGGGGDNTNQKPPLDLEIDSGAGDWNGQELPDKTPGSSSVGIKIPGYPFITLPAEQETVNVVLLNPEGNPCYFTFELVLKETGESLYKSKLVPPGQAITEITMTRPLSAGEYEATIKITTTSVEDGSAMNGANVETVLIVK